MCQIQDCFASRLSMIFLHNVKRNMTNNKVLLLVWIKFACKGITWFKQELLSTSNSKILKVVLKRTNTRIKSLKKKVGRVKKIMSNMCVFYILFMTYCLHTRISIHTLHVYEVLEMSFINCPWPIPPSSVLMYLSIEKIPGFKLVKSAFVQPSQTTWNGDMQVIGNSDLWDHIRIRWPREWLWLFMYVCLCMNVFMHVHSNRAHVWRVKGARVNKTNIL